MEVSVASILSVIVLDSASRESAEPTPTGTLESGKVCVPNISLRERRKRLAGGVIAFMITLAVLAVLIASGTSHWWRLALFPLWAGAASGFFQWRDKT